MASGPVRRANSITNDFESYVKLNKRVPPEVVGVVQQTEDYAKLADTVASHLAVKIPDRQAILEQRRLPLAKPANGSICQKLGP
jgi:ATP-dependent Lon protease